MNFVFRTLSVFIFLAAVVVRLRFYFKTKEFRGAPTKIEGSAIGMLRRLTLAVGQLSALLWVFGVPWLIELSIDFPVFIKWFGAFIMTLCPILLAWVHTELGIGFSRTLKIKDKHKLATTGPYRWIRHPMYCAFILMWAGFFLLSGNLVIGPAGLAYIAVIVIRISKEEKMLKEHFQGEYEDYVQRTGRLFPKLGNVK